MSYDHLKPKLPCFTAEQEYSPYTPDRLKPYLHGEGSVYAPIQKPSQSNEPIRYLFHPELQGEERMAWFGEELDRIFAKS